MQRAYLDAETKVVRLPLLEGPAPARLVINDTHFLFTADFKKSGPDLILTGDDGKKLVIANYFNFERHPDLVSPDGAVISAELVERLAGPEAPGQYAQAGAPAGAVVIGRVEIVSVNATVQHANGVVDNIKNGDSLLKGDVVMTGDGEGCTLSLIDGTALNMGANARMVLAELTYDSQSTSNSALINLVKGSFVFVAGQVAHTGGMRVTTPVATMGIRGTTVGTYLDADVNGNVYQLTATLLSDPGGSSGAYDLTDPVTGAVLQRVRSTATQVTLSHGANNQLSVQEETKSPAIVQHELAVAQILFPIFLANPNNAQLNQTTPQVPNNSLTPPQLLPQPPQETDPNSAVHFNLLLIGGLDAKTTSPGNNNSFILTELALINNPISIASISINAIAGNNIINLSGAQAGFAITGNETGADGQTVTVKVLDSGGNVVGSFTATAAGGNWFVGVSSDFAKALADGTYTLKATVSGTDGNPAPPATQTLTVDQTPPPAPGVALTTDSGSSNSDHITHNSALTLSGIEVGALVEYSLDSGKTWSNSFTAVEGLNTVQVRQTDVAGNVSGITSVSFTLDTVPPVAPSVALTNDNGSSATDHITNNGGLTLSGIEAGALVEYSLDGGKTWSNSFAAVEGPNTVLVRQTDLAGNASSATSLSFTLDTIAPAAPGVALTVDSGSSNSDHITNNGALTLSGIENGAIVQYSINNGTTWSNSFTAVEGVNTVQVRQTDVAGNVSAATTFSFTLDTHGPAAPGVALTTDSGSSNSDHITNNGALTLSGIEAGALVQYSIDNGQTWSNSFTAVEGLNTVQVRQTDVAGDVSSATSLSFTLDTHAPAAPGVALTTDSGSSNSDHITNNGALTLSGIENGAIVQYSINNGTTWSNSFTAVEGVNTVLVRQTGVAGNVSSATSFSFTLDTHAPAAPGVALTTDSGSSNSDHITNNGALTLAGIEAGALVQYSINNGTSWSNSFTAVEGPNTVLVRQTDVAGNVSSATSLSFTLDTHGPAHPTVAFALADIGKADAETVQFTVNGLEPDDNGAITFSDGNHAHDVVVNIVHGVPVSNSVNLFGLSDGPITATLLGSDPAGNTFNATATARLDPLEPVEISVVPTDSKTNVMLMLDLSGSMNDSSGLSGLTRLDVEKAAINELLDQYDNRGDVMVRIVTFSDNGSAVGNVWMSVADAKTAIAGLSAGGSTNYDAALLTAMAAFADGTKLTGPGTQNVSYFLSDGDPTANSDWPQIPGVQLANGIQANEQAVWESFLTTNNIVSFALGIPNVATPANLDPIAFDPASGTQLADTPIIVTDLGQLSNNLVFTLPPVTGSVLTGAGGAPSNFFGADGGFVQSITVDGVTYTFNPAANGGAGGITTSGGGSFTYDATTKTLTVDTDTNVVGGEFSMVMTTGAFTFQPPTGFSSESVGYVLVDRDGNTAGSMIDFSAAGGLDHPPIVRDDHVITNISGGSGTNIVIPDYALLYNDSDADGQTIAITGAITNVVGANLVTHASGNVTFTDNNTNGGSFTYTGSTTSPAASDTGNVTIDRSQTGTTLTGTGFGEILIGRDGTNNTINANEGNDVLIGGSGNDTLNSGAGADIMTGGGGIDAFIINSAASPATIGGSGDAGTISGYDVITDFAPASDILNLQGTAAAATGTTVDGTDSSLTINGQTIKSHTISNGIITFSDTNSFSSALTLSSTANVAAVVEYLHRNDLGSAGATVAFVANIGGIAHTYIFEQVGNSPSATNDVLVDLVGVTLPSLTTLIPSHILPAGVAGDAINLGLPEPADHVGPVTITIAGVPSDWTLSEGADNGDGSWTIQASNASTLAITSPDDLAGAMAFPVTMSWTNADGSSGFARVTDNVELFAQGVPIFALSGDDHLTGSSGKDLFVFAQPIGNDRIYNFNPSEDQVDLVGYAAFASFDDVKSHLTADANGNAVIAIADGQSITLDGVAAASLGASNFEFNQEPVTNNAGVITIGDGAVLPLSGIIDNTETITLDSAGNETQLQLIQNGITLQGGGQVILSDSSENFISGTIPNVTLTNVDNTISGAGQLGAGQMTLVNDDAIVATGTHALVIDTGRNAVINSGTLEATGSGGLIVNGDVANSGLIWANGGNITIGGAVTGSGTALVSGAATLELGSGSSDVSFAADAVGTLILQHPADFAGKISGFSSHDQIDLVNISVAMASIYSITYSLSTDVTTLVIADGTNTDTINLIGNYSINSAWHFSNDGQGGTLITDQAEDSGTATVNSSTTLEIVGATEQNVSFANDDGNNGTLVLDHSASFTGQISGFAGDGTLSNSDSIDLKDIDFAAAKETYSGGILTVTDDARTATLHFDGDYVLGNFVLASDDHGGTLVIDPPAPLDLASRFEHGHSDTGLQEAHGLAQEQTFSGFPLATADVTLDQFHFGNIDPTGFNGHANDSTRAISSFGSDHFQFAAIDTDAFHQTPIVHPLELDLHQAPLQGIIEAAAPDTHNVTPTAAEVSPAASVLDVIHAIHAHTA